MFRTTNSGSSYNGRNYGFASIIWHVHAVDDLVEQFARIHHLHHLCDQTLERASNIAENSGEALSSLDRQAMGREQEFGLASDHLSQRRCPFDRISLHLLRVAGVREVPDHEVAGEHPLLAGQPSPQMVVRLSTGMVELDRAVADDERVMVVDDVVRPGGGARDEVGRLGSHAESPRTPPNRRALISTFQSLVYAWRSSRVSTFRCPTTVISPNAAAKSGLPPTWSA